MPETASPVKKSIRVRKLKWVDYYDRTDVRDKKLVP